MLVQRPKTSATRTDEDCWAVVLVAHLHTMLRFVEEEGRGSDTDCLHAVGENKRSTAIEKIESGADRDSRG